MKDPLGRYRYRWPRLPLTDVPGWTFSTERDVFVRDLPEDQSALHDDSRWPAFFPSAMCFCTTRDVERVALEKVTGASVVNRFPYIVALSFCRQNLSRRHHARTRFTTMLERSGCAAIQFVPPGPVLDRILRTIQTVPEDQTSSRIAAAGLPVRPAATNGAPVFQQAHMVYEATLAQPRKDFLGVDVLDKPWVDVGSHRVYFLEVRAIQLRADIDSGRSKIFWRSLPVWQPHPGSRDSSSVVQDAGVAGRFRKTYQPNYLFPSAGTVSFEPDTIQDGMAIKYVSPSLDAQVEVDNDRARWPCMFPSSLGMITTWQGDGVPNVMPCGSTTVVSRSPLTIAPCITYASINDRYAPRGTLETIRRTGRFGCGVPFIDDRVVEAIQYAGSTSIRDDRNKVEHAGLKIFTEAESPVLSSLPIHYECEVVGEVPLGTHVMFLGEVRRIHVRGDVAPGNPLEWCPWARVVATLPAAFRRTLARPTITRSGLEELESLADPSNRRVVPQPEFAEALPR